MIRVGTVLSAAEAERLSGGHGGRYPTVRSRRPTGSAVYAVLIERVPTAARARWSRRAAQQGLGEAVVASTDPLVLRVGRPLPLRGAVELAERVRAAATRCAWPRSPQASAFVIRHGSFTSRDDAEAKRRSSGARLPAHQVVPVP